MAMRQELTEQWDRKKEVEELRQAKEAEEKRKMESRKSANATVRRCHAEARGWPKDLNVGIERVDGIERGLALTSIKPFARSG